MYRDQNKPTLWINFGNDAADWTLLCVSAGHAVSVLWGHRVFAHTQHRSYGGRRDLTKSCWATRISISKPESCASFCVAVLFPAAPLCSQILPARGPSETLWDHLLQEHHHRNLRGPLQTRQGETLTVENIQTTLAIQDDIFSSCIPHFYTTLQFLSVFRVL